MNAISLPIAEAATQVHLGACRGLKKQTNSGDLLISAVRAQASANFNSVCHSDKLRQTSHLKPGVEVRAIVGQDISP